MCGSPVCGARSNPNPKPPCICAPFGARVICSRPEARSPVKSRPSLFRRTALTVAAGLLVFQLASAVAMFVNLVLPLAHRSADDLADLLVLSARIWNELPPEKRLAFEIELREKSWLESTGNPSPAARRIGFYPYIRFLRTRLLPASLPAKPRVCRKTRTNTFKWNLSREDDSCISNFPRPESRRARAGHWPGLPWPVPWRP